MLYHHTFSHQANAAWSVFFNARIQYALFDCVCLRLLPQVSFLSISIMI